MTLRNLIFLIGAGALAGVSCGGSDIATGPTRGSIEVTTVTTSDGDDIDRNTATAR